MPKMKPSRKKTATKKSGEAEPLAGKAASEMFMSDAQRKLLDKGRDSLTAEQGVYKGLSKR